MKKDNELTQKELISRKVAEGLKPLDKLNFLEQYAIFMGKVQLVEETLKGLLIKKHGYPEKRVDKYTLGMTIHELKGLGLCKDFIALLEALNELRNDMAHNLLMIDTFGKSLMGGEFERLSTKPLRLGLIKVEETIHTYDFLLENKSLYRSRQRSGAAPAAPPAPEGG